MGDVIQFPGAPQGGEQAWQKELADVLRAAGFSPRIVNHTVGEAAAFSVEVGKVLSSTFTVEFTAGITEGQRAAIEQALGVAMRQYQEDLRAVFGKAMIRLVIAEARLMAATELGRK